VTCHPFSSSNLIEFWQGWHVTLSMVLRKLFYIPLKNHIGKTVAIFGVFLSSAMWHGVTINFLIWGFFHSFFFLLTARLIKFNLKKVAFLLLPFSIIIGRLIFADSDTDRLFEKLKFGYTDFSSIFYVFNLSKMSLLSLFIIFTFVLSEILFKNYKFFRNRDYHFYRLPYVQCLLFALTLLMLSDAIGVNYAVYGQR
jgi:alginate O-acetyltransferase complex protein AlgI